MCDTLLSVAVNSSCICLLHIGTFHDVESLCGMCSLQHFSLQFEQESTQAYSDPESIQSLPDWRNGNPAVASPHRSASPSPDRTSADIDDPAPTPHSSSTSGPRSPASSRPGSPHHMHQERANPNSSDRTPPRLRRDSSPDRAGPSRNSSSPPPTHRHRATIILDEEDPEFIPLGTPTVI